MKRALWVGMLLVTPLALAHDLAAVNDLTYVLQPDTEATIAVIEASDFDLVVMDYSEDASESGAFSPAEITSLKNSGKIVLAYLSIGEAEAYRYYWDATWNDQAAPDPDAPAWLGPFNPSFPDNYKVRYWDSDWQDIIYGTASGPDQSYLDRIIDQGFDGIYLDIIDGYYFWSEEQGEVTRAEARTDMMDFVKDMATYARVTRGVSDFLVFPQNGDDIVWDDDENLDGEGTAYLAAISGIGVEDVFYDETTVQPAPETDYRKSALAHFVNAGLPVLSVDYVWDKSNPTSAANESRYNDYETKALTEGYIPCAAVSDRDLNELVEVTAGGGPLFNQPKPNSPLNVDFAHGGVETGSASYPFATIGAALAIVDAAGTILASAGQSSESLTISQAVTLEAISGIVRIGASTRASTERSGFRSQP